MISSMAAMTSASSAAVRVDKATSEFLIGPDWTLNIDICDIVNSNQTLAKDVVKAVKRRLQHKNPKVQLLALTLLETMVKNCGDYVHFQIAERSILPEMVKIVKKKTDMHVRDKVLILIGSWSEAFGGPRGKYPQYYMAFEELRRSGVRFPQRPPDSPPILTPPVTHIQPQPGYGMPSSSSTRLDQAMAADDNLSLSSLNSMRDVLELLNDMLQAVDPSIRSAVKDEVIVDLVEQCRVNQKKLMQLLGTLGDEELLAQGLDLNDNLQSVLAKHDAIASGSPLPPGVTTPTRVASENHNSSLGPGEVITPGEVTPPAPVLPARVVDEEEEDDEEDDFAQLARRHSKTSTNEKDAAPSEDPAMSNALVPVDFPAPTRSKDQDLIDLLSLTLSTEQPTFTSQTHTPEHASSSTFSSETYPSSNCMPFNTYVAPWAQPVQPVQPQLQYLPNPNSQPQPYSQPQPLYTPQPQPYSQPQPVVRPQLEYTTSMYPPPPWAATPGYYSNQNPGLSSHSFSTPRPVSLSNNLSLNGEVLINSSSRSAPASVGQKPFIPSYRLFEDLDVFGNADGRFKSTSNGSPPSLSGSSNHSMVGGSK